MRDTRRNGGIILNQTVDILADDDEDIPAELHDGDLLDLSNQYFSITKHNVVKSQVKTSENI